MLIRAQVLGTAPGELLLSYLEEEAPLGVLSAPGPSVSAMFTDSPRLHMACSVIPAQDQTYIRGN